MDPSVLVRQAAVRGFMPVLACFWEMIPAHAIKTFLNLLVEELAFDASSVGVRVAVLRVSVPVTSFLLLISPASPSSQGMAVVLDNPLSHPILAELLPLMCPCLHDTSEKVQLAMLDLLLVVKELRTIKVCESERVFPS